MIKKLKRWKERPYWVDKNMVLHEGCHELLTGDTSGLHGNTTSIYGNATGVYGSCIFISGDISRVTGNISSLKGHLTGISGDITKINGDIDDCEITDEERNNGIIIDDLVQEDK